MNSSTGHLLPKKIPELAFHLIRNNSRVVASDFASREEFVRLTAFLHEEET
jgi:hypothetical protein